MSTTPVFGEEAKFSFSVPVPKGPVSVSVEAEAVERVPSLPEMRPVSIAVAAAAAAEVLLFVAKRQVSSLAMEEEGEEEEQALIPVATGESRLLVAVALRQPPAACVAMGQALALVAPE